MKNDGSVANSLGEKIVYDSSGNLAPEPKIHGDDLEGALDPTAEPAPQPAEPAPQPAADS